MIRIAIFLLILSFWQFSAPSFSPSSSISHISPIPPISPSPFQPKPPSLASIFRPDHSWVDTLSASHIRTIIATGDVIPARSVNYQTVKQNNFHWAFDQTADVLKSADAALINLETPLLAECPITTTGMLFCGNNKHIEGLLFAGIDIANLANNHMGNHGISGIEETKKVLTDHGIAVSGSNEPAIINIKGMQFAFLGYNDIGAPEQGIAWADETKIIDEIKQARSIADIIIVSFHWGVEYQRQPNERQKVLAHRAVDSGADLVIGNHPHWIQPVEWYKGKLITYAHGNFVFDQMWSEETKYGVVGKYTFYDNELIDAEYSPVYIKDFGQPSFLEGDAKNEIIELMYQESKKLY